MIRHLKLLSALLAAAMLFVTGCGSDDSGDTASTTTEAADSTTTGPSSTEPASDLKGAITVSGAKSLSDAFTRIGDDYEAANPDVEITFNFDSSSALATQILEGAPADVYASADEANMTRLTEAAKVAGQPEVFARNELVIVTKPGNPQGVESLADLAGAGVISLCGEDVPCGRYAEAALAKAGVSIQESSVTRGQNVGATLTAVAEGDAVAGIVYVTDAQSAGDTVEAVAIPADANVIATYPIGVIDGSENAAVAEAFMAWVLSGEGRAVLAEYGFMSPT